MKKVKEVKYVKEELALKLKEKFTKRLEILQKNLEKSKEAYLIEGEKLKKNPKRSLNKLEKISKKVHSLEVKIHKYELKLDELNSGKMVQKNIFQKLKDAYTSLGYKKQKVLCGIILLIPWILGFILFFAKPLITTIIWSFFEVSPEAGSLSYKAVFFQNYKDLFTKQMLGSRTFLEVLTVSIKEMVINVPIIFIFSLLVAVVLNTKFKGHRFFKAIFFIPVIFNATAIAAALDGAFGSYASSSMSEQTNLLSSFSSYLLSLGLGEGLITFLIDAVNRIFTIVTKSGIQILIFIASLQSVPKHLYEAAKVEGATTYECFWKITFPMLSPMFLPIIIYTIVDSFVSSDLISFMTVNSAGSRMPYGMQATIAVIYFIVNLVIIGIIYVALRKAVYKNDAR